MIKLKLNMRCLLGLLGILWGSETMALPPGFVYLKDIDPTIIQDMKYPTKDNFLGRPVAGYTKHTCILTKEAAVALAKLQQQLLAQNMSLKVYDGYRPQLAVDDFIAWSKDVNDQKMKLSFYPNINKVDFFKLGYVAEKSSHTRGSTVDLTLVQFHTTSSQPTELAMGTQYDFMDELSHTLNANIQGEELKNRLFLKKIMQEAGFDPYEKEWWHFTLKDEPYPDTYFNFPVD